MEEVTRRRFLQAAAVLAGGCVLSGALPAAWAGSATPVAVPPTLDGAAAILKGVINQYARSQDDAWTLMHGVRAMGRNFTTAEGKNAVDRLCSHFLKQKSVAGKSYLYMPVEHEGHTNAFLKTLLEAGVPRDHPFRLEGRRYTVGDLVDSAKALFSFDPKTFDPDDLAWTLIALSREVPPASDAWINAQGQRVAFADLVRFGFDTLDGATRQFRQAQERGVMPETKDKIQDFTCGGTHLIYGLASSVGNGHKGGDVSRRLSRHLDLLVWRLEADGHLMEKFYTQAPPPPGRPQGWEQVYALYQNDARIKFYGHSFEVLSYVSYRRLFSPTPAQARVIEKAGATLADAVKGIKGVDFSEIRKNNLRLFHLLIGDACHAYHGIHMVPGLNQV